VLFCFFATPAASGLPAPALLRLLYLRSHASHLPRSRLHQTGSPPARQGCVWAQSFRLHAACGGRQAGGYCMPTEVSGSGRPPEAFCSAAKFSGPDSFRCPAPLPECM